MAQTRFSPEFLKYLGDASKMAGRACLRACLSDYARSQATHSQAATESFEIGSPRASFKTSREPRW